MNGKKLLLIDTDIGADADDILALYAAIKDRGTELVGITTVFGNSPERARMAKKFLTLAGREDIPVYAGSRNALKKEVASVSKHTMMYESDLDCGRYEPDNPSDETGEEAVDFIIAAAERYGSELSILAIGPLTNIARAILKAPEALKKAGRVVIMGGVYFQARPEWNIFCDPEGAEVVFGADVNLYCVGADVTVKTKLPFEWQEEITALADDTTLKGYVCKQAKIWMDTRKFGITLHDPLAYYAIARPGFLHFKKQRICVETSGKHTRGFTVNYSLTNLYPDTYGKQVCVADYADGQGAMEEFMASVIRTD